MYIICESRPSWTRRFKNISPLDEVFYHYAYLRQYDSSVALAGTSYYEGKGNGDRVIGNHDNVRVPRLPNGDIDWSRIVFRIINVTEKEAFDSEMKHIKILGRICLGTGILRNVADGGPNPPSGVGKTRSQETIEKQKATKLRNYPNGIPRTEEQLLAASIFSTIEMNKPHQKELRRNITNNQWATGVHDHRLKVNREQRVEIYYYFQENQRTVKNVLKKAEEYNVSIDTIGLIATNKMISNPIVTDEEHKINEENYRKKFNIGQYGKSYWRYLIFDPNDYLVFQGYSERELIKFGHGSGTRTFNYVLPDEIYFSNYGKWKGYKFLKEPGYA